MNDGDRFVPRSRARWLTVQVRAPIRPTHSGRRHAYRAAFEVAVTLPGGGGALRACPAGTTSWVFDDPGAGAVLIVARPGRSPDDITRRVATVKVLEDRVPFVRSICEPRLVHGLRVTVWRRVPVRSGRAGPVELGRAVRALHAVPPRDVAATGLELRRWDLTDDVEAAVARRCSARGAIAGDDGRVLYRCLQRLGDELSRFPDAPVVLVHGDLHPGNVLPTADGVVLCDTDAFGVARADWDLAFLLDPGRGTRLCHAERAGFAEGYGRPLPSEDLVRTLARLAHLRRTVTLLELPRPTLRERWWNRVRLACWSAMLKDWSSDLQPAFERGRSEQARRIANDLFGHGLRRRSLTPPASPAGGVS